MVILRYLNYAYIKENLNIYSLNLIAFLSSKVLIIVIIKDNLQFIILSNSYLIKMKCPLKSLIYSKFVKIQKDMKIKQNKCLNEMINKKNMYIIKYFEIYS